MRQMCLIHHVTREITCVACVVTKPCFEFEVDRKKKSGHRHRCVDCVHLGRQPVNQVVVVVDPETKVETRFTEHEIATCHSKRRFERRIDALASAGHDVSRGRPLSVYRCPVCAGYHKTSKRLRWAVRPTDR